MNLKTILTTSIITLLFSANSFADDMYNFSESIYHKSEGITIKRTQSIHKTGNIYWLKIYVKTIDHSGRKPRAKYFYKCFVGNGTPYTNLTQSWKNTDKDLSGCPTG